ncbi:hypothetical protein [Bacillus wiedmannii]|uniref:hypothetical protein n=1 Tax=Bacillus wiedmannii TaxID=1890302 RepID=UPI000BFC4127|nr:hypothetical protein [Bacillus wiedmannii]PHD98827.1 hypothetical protein COF56_24025 [Bacillus wiedmannii]PHG66149.1 hypothetical protein COI55_19105 [Bacillus wiedmannii]
MSEQKSVLSVKVEVDTKEANENIKELTAAANECVEAFEKLEKVMSRFEKKPVKEYAIEPVAHILLAGKIIAQNIEKGTQV